MSEERLMILTMLQEGKISSEEALKLLETLDDENTSDTKEKYNKSIRKIEDKMKKLGIKMESLGEEMEDWGEKLGDNVENWSTRFEKKINHIGENISESANTFSDKFVEVVDSVIDNDTILNLFGTYSTIKEKFERNISYTTNPKSLKFEGVNGKINIRTWKENKLYIEIKCQVKNNKKQKTVKVNEIYELIETNDKISFLPKNANVIASKLDILIPEKNYLDIKLNTSNAKVIMENIHSENINVETSNAKIETSNCRTKSLNLKTSNGKINVYNINSQNLRDVNLSTSNSSIELKFDNIDDILFDLDAKTSIGHINIDIPNLVYKINNQRHLGKKKIIAYSENEKKDKKRINIVASTSNGSINIY